MTTASSRLLNRSWIKSSSVFLLRQRSSECDGKGAEATAPALGGRGFDLHGRGGRRRRFRDAVRPSQPRSLLPSLQDDGGASGRRGPGAGRVLEGLAER